LLTEYAVLTEYATTGSALGEHDAGCGFSATPPGGPFDRVGRAPAPEPRPNQARNRTIWTAVSPLGDFYLAVVRGQRHHRQGGKVRLRYLAAACATIGLALVVSACGGSSSSGSSGSGSAAVAKQITIWTTNTDFWTYQSSHLAPFTKATGIKVTVNAIPIAGILDKETIAQRAKSGAFAMYEGPTSLISQDVGLLGGVPLKPLVANSTLKVSGFNLNDMSELGNCSLNGTLYCLPQFVDGAILAYNKKLLQKAGITTPPTTWPQILADANTVTQKTGTPGFCTRGSEAGAAIATFHFGEAYYIPYSASNKGFMVGPHWNSLLDSPGAIKWATLYQQLMTKDAPKGVGAFTAVNCVNDFDQGKVAMDYDGITTFTGHEFSPAASSPIAGQVGFQAPQCLTSSPCMPLGPWGMFINPNVPQDQQNAAWKLMQYLSTPAFNKAEILARDEPGLAVDKSVAGSDIKGVPSDYLQALSYVAAHAEPAPFPPSTAFNQSQQDEEIAISQLINGTAVAKAMTFAANGQDTVFRQAGLLK
jgi:ABC-type glycerol-3-phosphate transport system substrate-binding protein